MIHKYKMEFDSAVSQFAFFFVILLLFLFLGTNGCDRLELNTKFPILPTTIT